jgi:hypothetical protein
MSICLVDPAKRKACLTRLSRCTCSYQLDDRQEDQTTILCVDPIDGSRMSVLGDTGGSSIAPQVSMLRHCFGGRGWITRKGIRRFSALTLVAWVVITATALSTFAQTNDPSNSFTDLSADTSNSGQISVLPGNLTFASQVAGSTSAAQIVTITNPGNSVVDLLIALSGDEDYVPYDTCIGSMAAGSSCTISMTFRPSNTGSSNGTLTITDVDNGYLQSVALSGSGTQQSSTSSNIALSASVASLQVTTAGGAATSDVYITPQNGFQGPVNLQCKVVAGSQEGSTASPVCSLSTSQVTISAGDQSSSELSVSIQTAGAISEPGPLSWRRSMSLAALVALGLLPLGRWGKRIYACLSLPLVMGMIGCGYMPNTNTATSLTSGNSYQVIVTATSGAQSTSISIPLEVK